jgi:solute carrier family 25 protein 33/36
MGAIVTSPFDVVKTRLQSSLFQQKRVVASAVSSASSATMALPVRPPVGLLYNFVETGHILR